MTFDILYKKLNMKYSKKTIELYENPHNVGSLDESDKNVGTGFSGTATCGDVMKLQIKVSNSGIIEDVKFKTFGCVSAIAASSYATDIIKGKTLDEATKVKNNEIAEELELPPIKIHCSILAEEAIKSAIADYKKKLAKHSSQE